MIERIKEERTKYPHNRMHTIVLGKMEHTILMRELLGIYGSRGSFNFVEGLRIVRIKEIHCFKLIGDLDV